MYYLESNCNICLEGALGFLRCSDGKTVVIMCDQCSSVWLRPEAINGPPVALEPPKFLLPDSPISTSGGASGWATLDEVRSAGMSAFAASDREYVR